MNHSLNILIVDDEERIVRTLNRLLKPHYNTFQAYSGDTALEIIRNNNIHVIVSDQRMPKMTGAELLAKIKLISPNTIRILLTGYSDLSAVLESVNQGEIFRYITKPWKNDKFLMTVNQAAEISSSLFQPNTATINKILVTKSNSQTKQKILVLDKEGELHEQLSQVIHNKADCILAKSLHDASKIILENDIDLITMSISLEDKKSLAFIKMIKTQKPNTLCLVVAESADIAHITSLINEGQIYRFVTKPIRTGQLKIFINSALRYYKQLADNPKLQARHKVEKIANKEEQQIANTFNFMWNLFRQQLKRIIS
jgi:DNA-binding NtrC family response regulator